MNLNIDIFITGLVGFVRLVESGSEVGLCALLVNQPGAQGDPIPTHYPRLGWGGQKGDPISRESYWNLKRERLKLEWIGKDVGSGSYISPDFTLVPKLSSVLSGSVVIRPECLKDDASVPSDVAAQFLITQGTLEGELAATACYRTEGMVEEVPVPFDFRPANSMPGQYPLRKVADMVLWKITGPENAIGLRVSAQSLDEPQVSRKLEIIPQPGHELIELALSNSPAQSGNRCEMRKGGSANAHFRRYEDFLKNPVMPASTRRVPHSPVKMPKTPSGPMDPSPANRPMCPPVEI